jgi:hypothetical protein
MRIGLKLTPKIKLDGKITSSGNGALHYLRHETGPRWYTSSTMRESATNLT